MSTIYCWEELYRKQEQIFHKQRLRQKEKGKKMERIRKEETKHTATDT